MSLARNLLDVWYRCLHEQSKQQKYGKTFTFIELVPSKKTNLYYRVKRNSKKDQYKPYTYLFSRV